jgi:hypothetical protein
MTSAGRTARAAAIIVHLALALITICRAEEAAQSIVPTNRMDLFNGKDFTGWTFCLKDKADPARTWSVTNGVIHCSGAAIGYLRTEKVFTDYTLTVEWRFVKIAPKADNTGVLVHMQLPDKVWPPCVQVQGKHERQGDLFLMAGAESNEHRGLDANTPLPLRGAANEKPAGEWNLCETVCAGDSVKTWINGRCLNETTGCTVTNGAIGIQSEGAEFEIREIFLEPLRVP